MKNSVLISILGPTAIGKTSVSIKIAKALHTEIISCDSRQFYKEMKIGTAVPSLEELQTVKHHFIQHLSIQNNYSVGDYEKDALHFMNIFFKTNSVLCLTGGSGLYHDAVTKGLDFFPKVDNGIRNKLVHYFHTQGLSALQKKLKKLDPTYYNKVDKDNPHRLIRALEICISSNKPYSSFLKPNKRKKRNFKSLKIGLTATRERVYSRIEQRVDKMFEDGLVNEVKRLIEYKKLNALQTVGYKEVFDYLEGNTTLEFAKAEIKKNTRRYAKRQLTWFRKQNDIEWFEYDESIQNMLNYINKKISDKTKI